MKTPYDEGFYQAQKDGSYNSAKIVVPIVREYVHPRKVIDVGCGLGTWLAVWKEMGAEVIGADGVYVERDMLYIQEDEFIPVNLAEESVNIKEPADLAMSLEVAEHLPLARAEDFVRNLTELSEVVLFSAAIPYQGGTNHINEQWPSYWAKIFRRMGYVPVDCIRPKIWQENVVICYAQNILLYVKEDALPRYPALQEYHRAHGDSMLNLVHPSAWQLTMRHLRG